MNTHQYEYLIYDTMAYRSNAFSEIRFVVRKLHQEFVSKFFVMFSPLEIDLNATLTDPLSFNLLN